MNYEKSPLYTVLEGDLVSSMLIAGNNRNFVLLNNEGIKIK
jgi:hypothetical protein